MLVVAIVALVPAIVARLSRIVSWPLERGGRIIPRLARENAARSPTRTAASASGLMIGLALVLFVTVYANGLRASTNQIIDHTLLGDFTIESSNGTSLIPAASARAAAEAPGVLAVSTLKEANARIGSSGSVTSIGVDPTTFGDVYRFQWINGSAATIANLMPGDAIVERDTARAANLQVGRADDRHHRNGSANDRHGRGDLQGPRAAARVRAAADPVRPDLRPGTARRRVREARAGCQRGRRRRGDPRGAASIPRRGRTLAEAAPRSGLRPRQQHPGAVLRAARAVRR